MRLVIPGYAKKDWPELGGPDGQRIVLKGARLRVRVQDAEGNRIEGEPLEVHLEGEAKHTAVTGPSGEVLFVLPHGATGELRADMHGAPPFRQRFQLPQRGEITLVVQPPDR